MFSLGFAISRSAFLKGWFFSLPKAFQKLYVGLFMAPIGAIPFVPQARYDAGELWSEIGGVLLISVAVVLWVSALRSMQGVPSIREARGLVTGGPYGIVRNPLYTANFLVLPGLGLATHSIAALTYAPVLFVLFMIQAMLEERELASEYGDEYGAYRERVPYRLIPFVL